MHLKVIVTLVDEHTSAKCDISVIHFNVKSMSENFNSVTNFRNDTNHEFSVVALSESWLKSNDTVTYEFYIDSCNFVSQSRSSKKGGGVGLSIHKFIQFRKK